MPRGDQQTRGSLPILLTALPVSVMKGNIKATAQLASLDSPICHASLQKPLKYDLQSIWCALSMGKKGTHLFKDWRILWILLILIIYHLSCVPTGEARAGILLESRGDRVVLPGVLTLLSLRISRSLLLLAVLFLLVLLALARLFTLGGRRACAKSCTHSSPG